jgi:predicted aspartyl protease
LGSTVLAQQATDSSQAIAVLWANERQVDDPIPRFEGDEVVLPFTMAGRLILLEAKVDTLVGNFILDTGAPFLVLNKSWFRGYGTTAMVQAGGITGGASEVMTTMVNQVQLGDISYNRVEADVIELGHIERSRGVPIFGLLGLNLFKSFELYIDYDKQQLRLYRLDKKGKPLVSSTRKAIGNMPFYLYNNTILMDGSLNGVSMRFCLDTGAEVNVLHNRLPKKAMEAVQINSRSVLSGTGNRKIEVLRGNMERVHVAKFHCPLMPTLITHLGNMSRAYNLRIDGMLGYDFLSFAPVSINFVTKEITFWELEESQP